MKKILIFREKHGERYFDASNNEAIAKACLKILTTRLKSEYWGYKPYKPNDTEILTDEQIDNLPERLRHTERDRAKRYKESVNKYNDELDWYKTVLRVVREQSLEPSPLNFHKGLPLAYVLLQNREEYEYERMELQTLEDVE